MKRPSGIMFKIARVMPNRLRNLLLKPYLFIYRLRVSTSYYNRKYLLIFKWLFKSSETANFTYDLTEENITYLAQTVAVVTCRPVSEIRGYMNEIINHSELKQHILRVAIEKKLQRIVNEKNSFGRRLGWYAVARASKPKLIVETGVERGHGALVLNYALIKNAEEGFPGNYIGTDIDPAAGALLCEPYSKFGKILYGDSIESLKSIQGFIDLFINDSDHSAEYEGKEYEVILTKLNARSIILGDNAHVTDKLSKFSLKHNRKFLFFKEVPKDHWYPGSGIGFSYPPLIRPSI